MITANADSRAVDGVKLHRIDSEPRFTIGTKFTTRGKHPRLCTVTDIYRTYNAVGETVRLRYVATHETMGQVITDSDVVETTIAMGLAAG